MAKVTPLGEVFEPVVVQALLNLVEGGFRIINPEGEDVTEVIRNTAPHHLDLIALNERNTSA